MNQILQITIYILIILVLSAFFGWIIAKWKMKRALKRIDRELAMPETIEYARLMKQEQDQATIAREVDQNERRRQLFRGYGDRSLIPIDIGRGKQDSKSPDGRDDAQGKDEGRSELQNPILDSIGYPEQGNPGTDKPSEENWPSFD